MSKEEVPLSLSEKIGYGVVYGVLQRPFLQPTSAAYTMAANKGIFGFFPSMQAVYQGGVNSLPPCSTLNFWRGSISEGTKEIFRAPGKYAAILVIKPEIDRFCENKTLFVRVAGGGLAFGSVTALLTEFPAQPFDYMRRRKQYGQPWTLQGIVESYKTAFPPNYGRMVVTWGAWYAVGNGMKECGWNPSTVAGACVAAPVQALVFTLPALHMDKAASLVSSAPDLYANYPWMQAMRVAAKDVGFKGGFDGLPAKWAYNTKLAFGANMATMIVPVIAGFVRKHFESETRPLSDARACPLESSKDNVRKP